MGVLNERVYLISYMFWGVAYPGSYPGGVPMSCYDCATFSKAKGVCINGHMGDKPKNYDKPKWMGCSWYKNPKEDVLTLFKEEDNEFSRKIY